MRHCGLDPQQPNGNALGNEICTKPFAPYKGNIFIIKSLCCPFRARWLGCTPFVGRCPVVFGRNPVRDLILVEMAFSQAKRRAVGTQSCFVYLHIYRVPTARCWDFHLFSTNIVSLTGHALATPPILYSMTKTVLLIINNLHSLPNTTGRCPTLNYVGLSALFSDAICHTSVTDDFGMKYNSLLKRLLFSCATDTANRRERNNYSNTILKTSSSYSSSYPIAIHFLYISTKPSNFSV